MEDYLIEYQTINERNRIILKDIEGEVLKKITLHVVPPEINIVFLHFDDFVLEVFGTVGSEILTLEITHKTNEHIQTITYPPVKIFEMHEIIQSRLIGDTWNGYGFELSFKGILDKTLIIQSIYAGHKPDGYEDCLRVGIGQYLYHVDLEER